MMEDYDDTELAFNLQVEETLTASLLENGAVSPSPSSPNHLPYDAVLGAELSSLVQSDSLFSLERELLDQYTAEAEARRARLDLSRQIHDRAFAAEIAAVPEREWRETGDNICKPYSGEGGSSSSSVGVLGFRVYVKGVVERGIGAVGVAVCDARDSLVFELGKCYEGEVREDVVEIKAVVEGLEVAVMLDLKSVTVFTDSSMVYEYVTVQKPPQTNVATLAGQISLNLRKLTDTTASLVAHNDMKFAYELARKAVAFQIGLSAANSRGKIMTANCGICLEDTDVHQMFLIPICQHSYCFACMSKHVQFKLLQGIMPKCPFENCNSELTLDSCRMFLTAELFDIMSQRVKEASIPLEDKIYCPYPRCSTLLSKLELQGSTGSSNGASKCPRCSGLLCIKCKVPWHTNMTCFDFKRLNPYACKEDKKLVSLANQNLWRQCPKCNHMVSLAAGCYHIYCRCGHEFCYTCGAEWKGKKPTCRCPIWDERNIVYDQQNRRQPR